jgi:UDP-GlcNAc:undecaprenyl-phosphate/decaprenyl-phosphate GlcNAc-1-phosphate transferase
MFGINFNPFLIGIISFVLAIISTYLVREAAHRFGFVAKPKADRWHKRPTAMMGGAAIFITTVLVVIFFVPHTPKTWVILGSSSFLFLVGLIDDILHIKPYQKLIGQLIGTAIVIGFGLILPWTNSEILNIGITVFWLIGITNAINLLDNMDGLAAGISTVAAFSLALGLSANGQGSELLFVSVFIGSLIGFLVFNFNPASIFMGDCGSMFIGFFLASSVMLTEVGGRSRSIFSVLAVPVLILFVPIFDTTFVTILRKMWGRKASQGGRDHTSHRLVALGLSERSAVLMLYAFAAIGGATALLVSQIEATQSIALIVIFILVLVFVGVYLGKVKVYEEQDEELALQNNAAFGFLVNLSYKRRIFEVMLDAILIVLAYYASYILVFGDIDNQTNWQLFVKTLPILLVFKLFSFLAAGVYRGLWRYTSIGDSVVFGKGVILGSITSIIAILFFYRFKDFSRAVFIVDAILLFVAISISRMAFRLFRQLLPMPQNSEGRKVLIYGAGDGGELLLRELKNNLDWNYSPIGFVDDDERKKNSVIHGLKVFGGNGSLSTICSENEVDEILLTVRRMSPEKLREVKDICDDAEILLKRAWLKIEPIDEFLD